MRDLSFFITQGPLRRPGADADLFDALPADISELCAVVRGVTLHPFWAELTEGDVPDFERVRELYESEPRLKVGATIRSFVQGEMKVVELELRRFSPLPLHKYGGYCTARARGF
jgi:hypothetical protein